MLTDALFNSQISRIAQAALKNRLPAVYDRADFVDAGGLMSYGVNLPDLSRRAAEYVHHILMGKKPGDLTLVQPTKFDLSDQSKDREPNWRHDSIQCRSESGQGDQMKVVSCQ